MENKLSILIPIYNEEDIILDCIHNIQNNIDRSIGDYEIIIIDDSEHNRSQEKIKLEKIKYYKNPKAKGFGNSIIYGLTRSSGDYVLIFMVDGSDSVEDLNKFYSTAVNKNLDFVFGDRWSNSKVEDYPIIKFLINRFINKMISILFDIKYSDFTNSFKLYSKKHIKNLNPLISQHFNITIELSLKSFLNSKNYVILDNKWKGDKNRISKLNLTKLFNSYFATLIYCYSIKKIKRL